MLSSQWLRSSRGLARRFSSVTEQFKQAISAINNESVPAPRPASNDTKLKMYGYFKQANDGPCTGGAPSMFDPVGRAKYNAWKQLGNLSKEEAMLKYIDEVKTIFNGELPATSTASNSSDASVSNSSTTTIPTAKNGKAIMESIIFKTISNDLTYSTINVSKNENGIFDVQLNRPDRGNSFNMIMWSDLTDSFADINKNSDAKVVVLSGSYGNFSTGMDLSVFVDMQKIAAKETCDARRREGLMKFIEYLQNAISSPENCAVPVIAAVSGIT